MSTAVVLAGGLCYIDGIANKETIVAAGKHLKALEKKYGGKIIPLDTEHSAIATCLEGENNKYVKNFDKIYSCATNFINLYPIYNKAS